MKSTVGILILAAPALGQVSNIDPVNKSAWGENIGWMNWRDAESGVAGVQVNSGYLSGFIWCENVGWLNVGDGTPGGVGAYSNLDGSDTGVNIDGNGDLFGFAWGENIGWVNFDTRAALTPSGEQARFDADDRRFRGYVWGENVGWMNLDDATHFVGTRCPADWNGDGVFNTVDFLDYLNDYNLARGGGAPVHGDPDLALPAGVVNTSDFLAYLNLYVAGC